MADVRPFHGIRYNPERTSDLSLVICPPYDVISPSDQEGRIASERAEAPDSGQQHPRVARVHLQRTDRER